MDFDKATLVKSGPEEVTCRSLDAEDGLSGRRPQINDAVGETGAVCDHVLSGTFVLVRIIVNAQLGFLD